MRAKEERQKKKNCLEMGHPLQLEDSFETGMAHLGPYRSKCSYGPLCDRPTGWY